MIAKYFWMEKYGTTIEMDNWTCKEYDAIMEISALLHDKEAECELRNKK